MAKLGISEFSFSFSFLHEQIIRDGSANCIPILPSLRKEAKVGWDAKLPKKGIDYYFQFKMSDYLTGGNASYIKDKTYKTPYFRFALHKAKKNRQHNLLYVLSQNNPHVYYVAPKLLTDTEFYTACITKSVTANSKMIPVNTCGYVSDSLQHFVSYPEVGKGWKFHSKPKSFDNAIEGEKIISHFEQSSKWEDIDKSFALKTYERIRQSTQAYQDSDFGLLEGDDKRTGIAFVETKKLSFKVDKMFDDGIEELETYDILHKSSDILIRLFGVSLMIVGETSPLP